MLLCEGERFAVTEVVPKLPFFHEKENTTKVGSELDMINLHTSFITNFMLIENILRLTRRIYLQEHIKIDIPSVEKQTRSDRMCKKTKTIFRCQKDSDRIVQRRKLL